MGNKISVNTEYNEDSISILDGLNAVRKRPGMYIGSTDSRGLHHLVWEIVDNSIDEALAGHGDEITVIINEDNSITVKDNGRGIPTGMHSSGRPTVEVIFTTLHAGGKFGGEGAGYKVSGGLHGVGSSVVNALSKRLEVEIKRDGKIFRQVYENGGTIVNPLEEIGKTKETGTSITFTPDSNIFSTTLYSFSTIETRVRESAFLISGLKMVLIDLRADKRSEFIYDNGISEYVSYLNDGKEAINNVGYLQGVNSDIEVEVAFQFTKTYNEHFISFVNNVRTTDGGTHEQGMKTSITRAFNEYGKKFNLLPDKVKKLEGVDIREGLTAIVSVRIPESLLQFEGQTKAKLGSPVARIAVENVVFNSITAYLQDNPEFTEQLIEKAIRANNAREEARKARDAARLGKKRNKKETSLSGKLSPAQGKDAGINELFLVEGDSAGGSAKQGRNRMFQAILPLRGKVINTEKAKIDEILKNEEINTMIYTIGAGFGEDFDITKANYKKIIIMTDADTDGAHIQVLILTFLFRYMKELIDAGRVYIALPPLYKVTTRTKETYCWSDSELKAITNRAKNYTIQRYKGLGEMNADQLWETTMNPETRKLIRVNIDDLADAERRIETLMGDKVEPRRDWIENNVSFTFEDDFIVEGR